MEFYFNENLGAGLVTNEGWGSRKQNVVAANVESGFVVFQTSGIGFRLELLPSISLH